MANRLDLPLRAFPAARGLALKTCAWHRAAAGPYECLLMRANHNRRLSGGEQIGLRPFLPHLPRRSRRRGFLFVEAHARSPMVNPQALPLMPGGPLRARALRGGTEGDAIDVDLEDYH